MIVLIKVIYELKKWIAWKWNEESVFNLLQMLKKICKNLQRKFNEVS